MLKSSRFARYMGTQINSFSILEEEDGTLKFNQQFPDDEDIRAFVGTFRLFLQQRELVSFAWLARYVLVDQEVSEDWKQSFRSVRESLNKYLDSPTQFINEMNGHIKTGREVMDVFIHGDIAHLDEKQRPIFERWRDNPVAFPMQQLEFYDTLWMVLKHIGHVLYWTEQELKA